jgi:hypothetical protein
MSHSDLERDGLLYVEVSKVYEEMFCAIKGRKFQAFRRGKNNLPASIVNKGELAVHVKSFVYIHSVGLCC